MRAWNKLGVMVLLMGCGARQDPLHRLDAVLEPTALTPSQRELLLQPSLALAHSASAVGFPAIMAWLSDGAGCRAHPKVLHRRLERWSSWLPSENCAADVCVWACG